MRIMERHLGLLNMNDNSFLKAKKKKFAWYAIKVFCNNIWDLKKNIMYQKLSQKYDPIIISLFFSPQNFPFRMVNKCKLSFCGLNKNIFISIDFHWFLLVKENCIDLFVVIFKAHISWASYSKAIMKNTISYYEVRMQINAHV